MWRIRCNFFLFLQYFCFLSYVLPLSLHCQVLLKASGCPLPSAFSPTLLTSSVTSSTTVSRAPCHSMNPNFTICTFRTSRRSRSTRARTRSNANSRYQQHVRTHKTHRHACAHTYIRMQNKKRKGNEKTLCRGSFCVWIHVYVVQFAVCR